MTERVSFSKISEVLDLPDLIETQIQSYERFLQKDVPVTKREPIGLQAAFKEVFPIESHDGEYKLDFVGYSLGRPKYNELECLRRSMTFAVPLKVKLRLTSKHWTKEQEVYLGELPLMTKTGSFIINGDERVVVSQLHRSPGVSFEETLHPSGKRIYSARIMPYRGAWLEFEFDIGEVLYVLIDRRRKLISTTLLRAMGLSSDRQIFEAFTAVEDIKCADKREMKALAGRTLAAPVVVGDSDTALALPGQQLSKEDLEVLWENGVREIALTVTEIPELVRTLERDNTRSEEEALLDIYKRLRPGEPPTVQSARSLLHRLFFDQRRYDMGQVGRHMINRKLDMKHELDNRTLDIDTVIAVMQYLLRLRNGQGNVDDIDHLGNRRVRTVGELVQNQFRMGLARLERSCRERMAIYDLENVMPYNLVNPKAVSSMMMDFYARSQLSQFMDQTNPLAELTHKRRLSALGPGGLSRERAGFEVRDVHHSHYGRICPIETPEGPNIGLISSLSTFSRVNEFGFIVTPYRKVVKGRVTQEIVYLSADEEDRYVIAQANARLDDKGFFVRDRVSCRCRGDFPNMPPEEIDFMDVSPRQLVSIAASLIPFLEHDDANRALMGSNMQRQAVPLLRAEPPLVGTGMESKVARDSGALVLADHDGVVRAVTGEEIHIGSQVYKLRKYARSNADTCINQRPLVEVGQRVKKGDIIADGPATRGGELALGRNLLVAFMPWRGYNFEDAILISERVVKEDVYTSIHIEEFEIEARDTRLGPEEITRDIPNVSEDALKDLDETGVVRIGAEVQPGDILVGKVTPKSETELTPEEKLLRAIFGEKAGDVRDASLTVPPGIEGIVVEVKVFSRKPHRPKTREELSKEHEQVESIRAYYQNQIDQIEKERLSKLLKLLDGARLGTDLTEKKTGEVLLPENRILRERDGKKLSRCGLAKLKLVDDKKTEDEAKQMAASYDSQIEELRMEEDREVERIKRGDELPPGVIKRIVVNVACKRKLSVGDKMAGRHGNKGVVAKILPEEDMPFTEDGIPMDIVLNPLGVPSRMNVGQILETHLGWAAHALGFRAISPVFGGATEEEIKEQLRKANLPEDGKTVLLDGFTGRPFDQRVTVGYIYILKLAHLVDDKIHARSIGPYSLVTQQPLGGKAQFGGQRFGEMEVWALEAYGAAYALQELLTVKSDDVAGRTRTYEAIVKGEQNLQPGTPESFNVLVKELQSLALDVRLEKRSSSEDDGAENLES
ncbi:MAG: DNA-directed RNA polymerase subunit beta [Candidatus Omnitrophica bacterium]|nr:DNA-directed RNA polymerase subunit beta [Candidatus Omnitrophota bacterium]